MKRRGMLLTLLCLMFVFAGLAACGDNPGKGTIVGAKDEIILKASETSYDFSAGVTGTLNGEAAQVKVDSSAVQFGVPGRYNVIYTLGDKTVTTEVKIYGIPTITASDAEQSYGDVLKWTVGVTAKDSLGDDLEILTTPPADYKAGDLLEYGKQYAVSYKTIDAAGNEATASRKLTVSEQNRPVFGAVTLTLTEFDGTVSFDTSEIVKVLDAFGEEVFNLFVKDGEGVSAFNPEYFAAAGAKDYAFTVVTAEGWNTLNVKVQTGDALKALTVEGDVTDFIFETGLPLDLPKVVIAEGNVNEYEISYEIVKADGAAEKVEDFQPVAGDYTFRISAKLASSQDAPAVIAEQEFKIRTGAKLIDYTLTDQNMDFFIPPTNAGAKLEFVPEVTINGDTTAAYRFTTATDPVSAMDNVLQFNQEMLAERIKMGLTTLTFEVAIDAFEGEITGAATQFYAQPGLEGYPTFAVSNLPNIAQALGKWTTYSIDLTVPFSTGGVTVYELDASGNATFHFGGFGLYLAFYTTPGAYVDYTQEIYLRNVRFGRVTNTSGVQNSYESESGRTVTLGADGVAKVDGQDYTYELYQNNTVLFFDAAERVSEFTMTFVPAGGEYDYSALVAEDGTVFLGRLVYEDGDVIALGAGGNVSFDLPDFAAQFTDIEGFAYSLRKKDGTELANAPGAFTFTESGLYEWKASFPSGESTDSYIYNIYVCAADDPIGKITTTDKDGVSKGSFRFDRMEGEQPVFLLSGAEMYLDGDYVQGLLDAASAAESKYQLWVYELPNADGVSLLNGQCYITWDGQKTSTAAGCYSNPSRDSYAFFPGNLAGDGIARAGEEDFRIYYPNGGPREITSIRFKLIPMAGEITGAKDIYLLTDATEYDFLQGVTGTLDGVAAPVRVDSSKVEFGTPGTYDVVYTLGNASVTVKVHITDNAIELLSYEDISGYVFPVANELISFPKVTEPGGYEYEFEYRVYCGEEDKGDADAFTASVAGDYIYVIRARVKGQTAWTELSRQPFFLRDGEAAEVFDPAVSAQNMDFFIAPTNVGAKLEFVPEVTIDGDTSPAYRYTTGTNCSVAMDNVLRFNQEKLAEMVKRGLTTLTFEIGTVAYNSAFNGAVMQLYGEPAAVSGVHPWAASGFPVLPNGSWTTYTVDLTGNFTSAGTPPIYQTDEANNVVFSYREFGIYCAMKFNAEFPAIPQEVYLRNIRFGRVADTAEAQNTYSNEEGAIVLGAAGAATVKEQAYTYELYSDGTVLFFNDSTRVFEFSAKYVKAGGEYGNAALVLDGKAYLGDMQFEDGDILALGAEGNVSFELPDFAAELSGAEGFKYELKKIGGAEVLASAPGAHTLTEAGGYEWVASYVSGASTKSYAYRFYVCAADDPIGKVTTVNKDGVSNASFRFDRMEVSGPVFLLTGDSEIFLDGDYVAEQLAASAEAGGGYQLRVYVNNPRGQCYIMWEGQIHTTKPGCYANIGEYYALGPDMLAYVGEGDGGKPAYTRQGNENLSIWFQGGSPVEITSILYQKF